MLTIWARDSALVQMLAAGAQSRERAHARAQRQKRRATQRALCSGAFVAQAKRAAAAMRLDSSARSAATQNDSALAWRARTLGAESPMLTMWAWDSSLAQMLAAGAQSPALAQAAGACRRLRAQARLAAPIRVARAKRRLRARLGAVARALGWCRLALRPAPLALSVVPHAVLCAARAMFAAMVQIRQLVSRLPLARHACAR